MSDINVNVKGKGQLNIGNLAQGEDVKIISGDMNLAESEGALVMELLKVMREAAGDDDSRAQAVESKVQELGKALATEPRNPGKIKEILSLIKEHHDWAFPAIAAIVRKVAPALAALL